jgi:hypothetical protein
LPNTRLNPGSVTKSCEGVRRRLGISNETLRGWCRQAQIDAGERESVSWIKRLRGGESDLSRHTVRGPHRVATALNTRPGKTLDWRTPAEAIKDR